MNIELIDRIAEWALWHMPMPIWARVRLHRHVYRRHFAAINEIRAWLRESARRIGEQQERDVEPVGGEG